MGFVCTSKVGVDRLFDALPGREDHDEIDLESLSISDGRLWLCSSHCRVRKNRTNLTRIDERIVDRPSRCLLGAVPLLKGGGGVAGEGAAFPWKGADGVRALLTAAPYVAPFVDLPSKENSLDIEGLCVLEDRLFLGLRGPVVDSIALVAGLAVGWGEAAERGQHILHFLNLGGLGVRDLASVGRSIIVLAGPVSAANGPFRLCRWRPKQRRRVQNPRLLAAFGRIVEHPEGTACSSTRDARDCSSSTTRRKGRASRRADIGPTGFHSPGLASTDDRGRHDEVRHSRRRFVITQIGPSVTILLRRLVDQGLSGLCRPQWCCGSTSQTTFEFHPQEPPDRRVGLLCAGQLRVRGEGEGRRKSATK